MILLYLLLGTFIATLGAIPLGAVNLAVINTSIKENIKKATYIVLAAGIGEVLLAFFALHCSLELSAFFQENQWIQIISIFIFFVAGIYFISFKSTTNNRSTSKKKKLLNSKFLTGFSLAILNPPVILYWIIVISLTNKYIFELTAQSSIAKLLLFFLGIYLGKITTLYFYSRLGSKIANKKEDATTKLWKVVGIVLVVISVFQSIKVIVV